MAFRLLATFLSLGLAVNCLSVYDAYYDRPDSSAQIEEFNRSSYGVVSSNYHLVRFPCPGCILKLSGGYGHEYLVSATLLSLIPSPSSLF